MVQTSESEVVLDADGVPLMRSLQRSLRRQKMRALILIAPLLLFILLSFLFPIASMLWRSVDNSLVSEVLPRTASALQDWPSDSDDLPPDTVYKAFADDLKIAVEARTHTRVGSRLNYEQSGMSSLFRGTGRKIKRLNSEEVTSYQEAFIEMDSKWGEIETWQLIKRFSPSLTPGYYLNAVDLVQNVAGDIGWRDEDERIYLMLFGRTLFMSLTITLCCLFLGYPVAWLLANLPARKSNLLMILVLLPFWTSLLVRTSAWKVLLQNQGVINDILVALHLVADNDRFELINNQFGTIVAMTHILLPFMILPLYSVMKTVPPSYMRAAKSLGANDWTAFWRVYFPQSIPGIGAGAILVFILAIGYYITPELVGGTTGVFISNRIAYHISYSLNWGLGAALGAILLLSVLILYWCYDRIIGIDNVKLG